MSQYHKSKISYKFYITTAIAVLLMITTLVSVGFGALNQNLSIAGDVEYTQDAGNMIMQWNSSSSEDFHNSTYKTKIKTVDFLDNKNIPVNAIESWDVSVNPNTGKVIAWIIDDPNNGGYYKLYIGANGDVVANFDSRYIFYEMNGIETIHFNNNFDTSKATDMSAMFYKCASLISVDITNFNTSQVTNMSSMFWDCSSLISLDVTHFDTAKVTKMYNMFYNCSSLISLDASIFNTSQVTDMSNMFYGCSGLTSLDITSFNTFQVTNMSEMFYNCNSLTNLDVTHFNTSNVTTMYDMFNRCRSLTNLDVTHFNTSQVKSMAYMFCGCRSLTTLNITNFDTSQVTNMSNMFENCKGLTSIDVSSFNTSNVKDISRMFVDCSGLISLDLSNFDTSKVTITGWMFSNCTALESVNMGFNTSQVTNMNDMFYKCSSLTNLDLTSFDTSQVLHMEAMFQNCSNLTEIKISSLWDISNVIRSSLMFSACTNLPNYNSSYVDKVKAIPTFSGGYLTLDMDGKYFSIVPDSNSYTISSSITGYGSNQTINPSELTKWRVINSNNVGNLELVSDNVSSTKVYFSGVTGYANLVSGLQTIASQYAKSGITSSVRCMGYNGQTGTISPTTSFNGSTNSPPSTTSTPTPTSGTGQEYGSGVRGDTLYLKDYLLVKNVYGDLKANTVGTSTPSTYWLASRRYDYYSNTNYGFFGRTINEAGELVTYNRLRHYFDGWIDTNSNFAIRPIMTLNNNITITGGSGTLSDPYTIS